MTQDNTAHAEFSPISDPISSPISADTSKKNSNKILHSFSTPDLSQVKKLVDLEKNIEIPNIEKYSLFSRISSIKIEQIKNFVKADIPLSINQYPLCPHAHHCLQNAIFKGLFRTFAAAYVFKTSVTLVSNLFTGKLFESGRLSKIYLSEDSIKFAQFLSLMSFSYKAIVCLLRRFRKQDPLIHKFIAGFIAGTAILLDDPSRRNTLALYCIVRVIADVITYSVAKKKLPTIPQFEVILFTASQVLIMFGLIHAPYTMDKKYYNWILNMGNFKHDVVQKIFRSPTGAMYRLEHEPFVECSPLYHKEKSCIDYNIKDWLQGFTRASRIYIPVHFLPSLLLTPKKVFYDPLGYFKNKIINTIRSSIFLTTYQSNMKLVQCFGRNLVRDDPWWLACLGGFFAGLSLLLEHVKRRRELTLYCLPRAIEILIKIIIKKNNNLKKYINFKLLSLLLFQLTVGLWMVLLSLKDHKKYINRLNFTILIIVFDTIH